MVRVPLLEKIVVTTHVGNAGDRKQAVEDAVEEISRITGQKPSISYARKSVASFKVREGEAVGARVTLRGNHMWEFLDRFINITAPNIRDFRGITPKSFDGRGNYALGINDQSIFPEVELDKIKRDHPPNKPTPGWGVGQTTHPANHPLGGGFVVSSNYTMYF